MCFAFHLISLHIATSTLYNLCALLHLHFATHVLCNMCTFVTCVLCNICTLQHVHFACYNKHSALCIEPTRQISQMDQHGRSAKRLSQTDQLDGPVLFKVSIIQFAYLKIDLSVCTSLQLLSPPKALFILLWNSYYKKISKKEKNEVYGVINQVIKIMSGNIIMSGNKQNKQACKTGLIQQL